MPTSSRAASSSHAARATSSPAERAARRAVERIRKLLAVAADQPGTPEGESAARIARRLMAEHDVAGRDLDPRAVDPIGRVPLAVDGTVRWRRKLAAAVARHCECVLSWSPGQGNAYLYGRTSGIALAEYLLAVFQREVEEARTRFDHDLPLMMPEADRRSRWSDFCGSAVLAIEIRLRGLREEEARVRPEDCVLVSRRGEELRDWLDEQGVRFKKGAPDIFHYDPEGYAAGQRIVVHDAVRVEPLGPDRGLGG